MELIKCELKVARPTDKTVEECSEFDVLIV